MFSNVVNAAMNQLKASPEDLMKGVEKFQNETVTTTEGPIVTTLEPIKTIIARYPDLIFHPDMTDLLMFIIGLLFSSVCE